MKSYIIRLKDIETSMASAALVKQALDDFNMPAEYFDGTKGDYAREYYAQQKRVCHPWGLKGPERLLSEEAKLDITRSGVIGCFDSHYRLWQLCVEKNEPIIVFEDDVMLIRPFFEVEWQDVLSVAFSHAKKMAKYINYLDNPIGLPMASPYGQSTMPGNGGYAIKPHAAKVLVETYANTFLPADNAINQYLVKIQIHNYMMGRASTKHEGNTSLIKTSIWDNQ
jgi:glycosyl transferase family 25